MQLWVAGPGSDGLMESLGAARLVGQPEGSHAVFGAGSEPVVIVVGSGFSAQGYSVVASEGAAAEFWQRCIEQVQPLTDAPGLHREQGQPVAVVLRSVLGVCLTGCCVAGGCSHGRAGLRAGSRLLWQASCRQRAH